MNTVLRLLMIFLAAGLPVAAGQKVVIKGSNTFGEELAPRLIEEYRKKSTGVTFDLESKGTGSGFAALLAGECDIAAASRLINEDESRQARARALKMNAHLIGYYGVAVIVNEANPVRNLSITQVRDIFTGATRNWSQVGGRDGAIQTCIRDPVSGTYLGFQELAMERKPYDPSAKMFRSYAEIIEAVRKDPNGIGYAGMNLAEERGIAAVRINHVTPTVNTVNEGLYPYARALRLYTSAPGETAEARAFIRWVQSRPGQRLLSEIGFVRRFEPRWWPFEW
jgi:phosphate transport system substrate-binding protein